MSTAGAALKEFETVVIEARKSVTVMEAILHAAKQGKALVQYNPDWDGISPDRFLFQDLRSHKRMVT